MSLSVVNVTPSETNAILRAPGRSRTVGRWRSSNGRADREASRRFERVGVVRATGMEIEPVGDERRGGPNADVWLPSPAPTRPFAPSTDGEGSFDGERRWVSGSREAGGDLIVPRATFRLVQKTIVNGRWRSERW